MKAPPDEYLALFEQLCELHEADPWASSFRPGLGKKWTFDTLGAECASYRFPDLEPPNLLTDEGRAASRTEEGRAQWMRALQRAVEEERATRARWTGA